MSNLVIKLCKLYSAHKTWSQAIITFQHNYGSNKNESFGNLIWTIGLRYWQQNLCDYNVVLNLMMINLAKILCLHDIHHLDKNANKIQLLLARLKDINFSCHFSTFDMNIISVQYISSPTVFHFIYVLQC